MSEMTPVSPTPDNPSDDRPSIGHEIAREATINVAASAASAVGFVAGLVAITKVSGWLKSRKDSESTTDTDTPQAPDTQA